MATNQQSFSDFLLSSSDLDDLNNECLDQLTADVVNRSKTSAAAAKAAGLKRKPSASFQTQRSQVYEYLPGDDNPAATTSADFFADYKDGDITTFVTSNGEQHIVGLGLDLDSLNPPSPSFASTVVPDPIPYKQEPQLQPSTTLLQTAGPMSRIEPIPDLIHLAIPPSTAPTTSSETSHRGRLGHAHRNSVELTGLAHQFGSSLHTTTSPVHQRAPHMMMPSSYAPSSPVNQLHMGFPPSPVHHMQASMMPPSSPARSPSSANSAMLMPMPLPISVYSTAPMPLYGFDHPAMMMPHSPALSMSDQFGQFNMHSLSQPSSPSSQSPHTTSTDKHAEAGREKREYKCRQCGQPKSGHTCTSIKSMMDSAVQHESTPSNMTDWRILTVKSKWVVV
ncbi:hypothetical protein H310_12926 [Aphanomyces invadans]|uniref:Uncharacterized protein n=1 Tax=Aphanomyces invadans TaxID=157072 RepID=A0A024TFW7_9STRA|nr:hypothetical protein H310_12926 [Aphanomyces invadans]ETV92913.1 hypothetical protein H310_12926 [Aphanomyces invadans]|eukprot:XP_008878434.1 hypothetical protein H310_12926 [Aphanomyces invadans]